MVGSLMALEVVREIVGFGTSMVGRLALFDLAAMRFETLSYGWDEDNPLNGPEILLGRSSDGDFCASGAHELKFAALRFSKSPPTTRPSEFSSNSHSSCLECLWSAAMMAISTL